MDKQVIREMEANTNKLIHAYMEVDRNLRNEIVNNITTIMMERGDMVNINEEIDDVQYRGICIGRDVDGKEEVFVYVYFNDTHDADKLFLYSIYDVDTLRIIWDSFLNALEEKDAD